MSTNFTIGRVDFGPRDSFVTLGSLIEAISTQEELVEDLCIFAGNLLTENLWLQEHLPAEIYEL
jgi:hypothetical protein